MRLCATLLLSAAMSALEGGASAAEDTERMASLLEAGDYEAALQAAEERLAVDSKDAAAHLVAGTALHHLSNYGKAQEHLKKALSANRAMPGVHFELGNVYRDMGRAEKEYRVSNYLYSLAVGEFEKELMLSPGHLESLEERAELLLELGKLDAALDAHEAWVRASGGETRALVGLAEIYWGLHRCGEISGLAERLPPGDLQRLVVGIYDLLDVLFQHCTYEQARPLLDRLIGLEAPSVILHELEPLKRLRAGDYLEAVRMLESYLDSEPPARKARFAVHAVLANLPVKEDRLGQSDDALRGIEPPQVVSRARPEYPEVARRARMEGWVVLFIIVREDASPSRFIVLETSNPIFDKPSIEAVKRWKFEPATRDGKPVPFPFPIRIKFALH